MLSDATPRYLIGAAVLAGAILATACTDTRGGTIPYDHALGTPDELKIEALEADYKILPTDKLTIKVFKADDLSGDYDVDLAGNIALPLIGEVQAATLTTAQLDQRLTEKLGEKYFQRPDVSVSVKQSTKRAVTVDGAVQQGGTYPVPGTMSLIQAIALARGTTEDANARRVAVFRTIGGQRQAAAFDLTAIRRGQAPDPEIYPGDIVVVDGSAIKAFQKQIFQTVPLLSIFKPF